MKNRVKIAVLTINQPSLDTALNLKPYLDNYEVDIYSKKDLKSDIKDLKFYNKLDDILPSIWEKYDFIIAILAIGAVVRKIAPFLQNKSKDPAVLVINLALDKIVPLIGGHIGGANQLTEELTQKLPNCINFISTATDQTNTIAFDMVAKKNNWGIENLQYLANISNRLLNKLEVKVLTKKNIFNSLENRENLKLIELKDLDKNTVIISPLIYEHNLILRPKIFLGIGCNKGVSFKIIEVSVKIFLAKYDLKMEQIEQIGSFEAKKDEIGLLKFANKYNLQINFYKKDDINSLDNRFTKSASTKFFGLKGVAEPSAILSSKYKELIIKKQIYNRSVTIAGAI